MNAHTVPSMEFLARKNAHPRDAMISFDEPNHIYTIRDDDRKYNSVTTLNGELFEHFDSPATAATIARKPDDDRKKAAYHGKTAAQLMAMWDQNGKEASGAGTAMHMDIERFFNGVPVLNPTSVEFCYFLQFWKLYGNGFGLAIDPDEKGDPCTPLPDHTFPLHDRAPPLYDPSFAAQDVHEYLTLGPDPDILREENTGVPWGQPGTVQGELVPYRTEWCVWHEDYQLAGSIDMIFENPDGTLQIYDWKRVNKDLGPGHPNPRFPKYGIITGLDTMVDSPFWHYALQLNMYKRVLETKYGKQVTALYLVCLHPTHPGYLRIHVPFIPGAIDCVLRYRKAQLQGNAEKFKIGPRKLKRVLETSSSPEKQETAGANANTGTEKWLGSDDEDESGESEERKVRPRPPTRYVKQSAATWQGSDNEEEESPVTRKTTIFPKTGPVKRSQGSAPEPIQTSSTGKYPSAFAKHGRLRGTVVARKC